MPHEVHPFFCNYDDEVKFNGFTLHQNPHVQISLQLSWRNLELSPSPPPQEK